MQNLKRDPQEEKVLQKKDRQIDSAHWSMKSISTAVSERRARNQVHPPELHVKLQPAPGTRDG